MMTDEEMDQQATDLDRGTQMDAIMRAQDEADKAEALLLAEQEEERIAAWCVSGFGHQDTVLVDKGEILSNESVASVSLYECEVCGRLLEVR